MTSNTDSGGSAPNDSVVSFTTSFAMAVNYDFYGGADDASNAEDFGLDSTTTGSYGVDCTEGSVSGN